MTGYELLDWLKRQTEGNARMTASIVPWSMAGGQFTLEGVVYDTSRHEFVLHLQPIVSSRRVGDGE